MTTVILDVNETMLNLGPIRRHLGDRFGDDVAQRWFAELLRLTFVLTAMDEYRPFTDLAGDALAAVTDGRAEPADREDIGLLLRTLPLHADVRDGLDALRAHGCSVAALTNSPQATVEAQLTATGIIDLFDAVMSVDAVARFKPHPEVYRHAAQRLGVPPSGCAMIAAHDWDVAGAMAAGYTGIFLERPGASWSVGLPLPNVSVMDLPSAARWIAERG